jgi:hypothetical protein
MNVMNTMYRFLTIGLLVLVSLFGTKAAYAGIEIGLLTCKTVDGTHSNLLIHSTVGVKCVFEGSGVKEDYKGETGIGLGIDLNFNKKATMAYTVLSAMGGVDASGYKLAGKYAGGKGAATVGIGVGAAVLLGGGDNNFTLQPVALEGSTGFGVEGGLTYLYIEPDRKHNWTSPSETESDYKQSWTPPEDMPSSSGDLIQEIQQK